MKKKRAQSFLGIHFDFHAMPGQTVCRPFRPDLTARMLDAVRPDFVQCDTKGHPGLSPYPTDVGNRADEILHDPLRMWRDLTEERDIALYGHHSGLYDRKAAELHPDWAVVDENGKVSQDYLSPFSPYADELLIPQLKELCDEYRLDGAWVDGECWGLYLDYGPYAAAAYEKETGKKTQPRRGEEGYAGYREFCREGFRRYVAKYVNALKEHNPDFEVTSNWMYSAYMPEPLSAHVDFLSGDYATSDSMESARFQGRCLAARGMTWDLMAWGQNAVPCSWQTRNRTEKEAVQYCQEASEVLALGGAFQFFNIMYGGGGILQEWMIPTWEKTAAFCRERQVVCFGARLIPQVGILYPEAKSDERRDNLYTTGYPELSALRGWMNLLQDSRISTSVLYEYQLTEDTLREYPAVVVPSVSALKAESVAALCAYVRRGGRLLTDRQAAPLFSEISGVSIGETETKVLFLDGGSALASLEVPCANLLPASENSRISGVFYEDNYYDDSPLPAAVCTKACEGSVTVLAADLGHAYTKNATPVLQDFALSQLRNMGFAPLAEVSGTGKDYVDVILTRREGEILVNLVNYAGPHRLASVRSYREIPPLGPLTVTVRMEKKPQSVTLHPGGKEANWQWQDCLLTVDTGILEIHTCIRIKET